jgi:hypothetical protein
MAIGYQPISALFPAESALFVEECNFQCRSLHKTKIFPRKGTRSSHKTKNFPQKRHSFIAQNQIFYPEKKCFFATRKDVESYSQMPGKRILALEF